MFLIRYPDIPNMERAFYWDALYIGRGIHPTESRSLVGREAVGSLNPSSSVRHIEI